MRMKYFKRSDWLIMNADNASTGLQHRTSWTRFLSNLKYYELIYSSSLNYHQQHHSMYWFVYTVINIAISISTAE